MYLVIVHLSKRVCKKQKTKTDKEKIKKEDRLGVSSTCFQLNQCRKRANFKPLELKKQICMSHLELSCITSAVHKFNSGQD